MKEDMTFDEYQREAARTGGSDLEPDNVLKGLSCAGLGIAGEAGEVADIIKKIVHHRHPLDELTQDKLAKELGDVLWYIAHASNVLGLNLADIAQANIDKLRKRYPDGFSAERSINRDKGDGQ